MGLHLRQTHEKLQQAARPGRVASTSEEMRYRTATNEAEATVVHSDQTRKGCCSTLN